MIGKLIESDNLFTYLSLKNDWLIRSLLSVTPLNCEKDKINIFKQEDQVLTVQQQIF